MPDWIFTVVGLVGPVLFTWAYLQISLGNWHGGMAKTHLYNLVGAGCILVSLIRFWNLPVFVLEICWGAISLYGLYRTKRV